MGIFIVYCYGQNVRGALILGDVMLRRHEDVALTNYTSRIQSHYTPLCILLKALKMSTQMAIALL